MKKSRVWALIVSVISVLKGKENATAMIAVATVVPRAEGAGSVIQEKKKKHLKKKICNRKGCLN